MTYRPGDPAGKIVKQSGIVDFSRLNESSTPVTCVNSIFSNILFKNKQSPDSFVIKSYMVDHVSLAAVSYT